MALHFSRDTKVFIQTVNAADAQLGMWEIPVLDGYSFSQAANASEVTLQEMTNAAGTSRRSRKMFNDSMAPAEWSFTTYMRPFKTTATGATVTKAGDTIGDTHAVEEVLWAAFAGDAVYNTTSVFASVNAATTNTVDLVLDGNSGTIATGMVVTGTGISGSVTVTTVTSQTVLVLSSNQTLADNAVLTFTTPPATANVNTATTSSTALVVDGNAGQILAGMVVTGTGISGTVTVATVTDQNNLVLSSAQTLADDAALTFTIAPTYTLSNITNGAGANGMEVSFANSNKSALGTFNLFFKVGGSLFYKLSACCVNEASIDFDIDGIASINWSGFGKEITDLTELTTTAAITEGRTATDTSNFIRNRLTSLTLQANSGLLSDGVDGRTTFNGSAAGKYSTVLTGGNITLSNNLTFLTPETLGIVNLPLEHVTGTRSAGGSFTCYLNSGADGDSADLYDDLISNRTVVTNSFDLDFAIGGSTGTPRVEIGFPAAHLEVPTTSIDDVLGLEFTFAGLATDLDSTDETTIKYIAPS